MAQVTETTGALTDGGARTGIVVSFEVLAPFAQEVRAVAADPDNPTIRERIFVTVTYPVVRSDAADALPRRVELVHVDDDSFSQFNAGDTTTLLGLLKKIFDSLVPAGLQ